MLEISYCHFESLFVYIKNDSFGIHVVSNKTTAFYDITCSRSVSIKMSAPIQFQHSILPGQEYTIYSKMYFCRIIYLLRSPEAMKSQRISMTSYMSFPVRGGILIKFPITHFTNCTKRMCVETICWLSQSNAASWSCSVRLLGEKAKCQISPK